MPTLGLGLAALGRPGYVNLGHSADLSAGRDVATMRAHAHTVLSAAYQHGLRYFDAARSYGLAEDFLATWLHAHAIPPAEVTIASKWGYTYTANWQVDADVHEVKEHTLPVLQRQWAETQTHLSGYLNLYQIHSASLDSGVLSNPAVLTELARLKATGVEMGLSLSGLQQTATLRQALAITIDGQPLFSAVQGTWNLLERSVDSALADAHAAGWHVIIKEAVANGRLTPRNPDPALAPLHAQAARLNCTIDALALAAVLARPWVSVVLSGATTVAQLESNLTARTVPYDDEAEAALTALIEPAEVYWHTRSQLPWN